MTRSVLDSHQLVLTITNGFTDPVPSGTRLSRSEPMRSVERHAVCIRNLTTAGLRGWRATRCRAAVSSVLISKQYFQQAGAMRRTADGCRSTTRLRARYCGSRSAADRCRCAAGRLSTADMSSIEQASVCRLWHDRSCRTQHDQQGKESLHDLLFPIKSVTDSVCGRSSQHGLVF